MVLLAASGVAGAGLAGVLNGTLPGLVLPNLDASVPVVPRSALAAPEGPDPLNPVSGVPGPAVPAGGALRN
jgi:hypothetical protein